MAGRRRGAGRAGQGGGAQLDGQADQALPGPVDAGLGAGPLAGPQREPAELAQHPADGAVLLGELDRRAHLAENLALADHDRVQPAGHGQQVGYRPLVIVHVQVRGEVAVGHAAVPGEQLADGGHARVEPVHVGVDLDPVARRDDEGLGHRVGQRDVVEQLGQRVAAHRGLLQDRHRCALVAEPDH